MKELLVRLSASKLRTMSATGLARIEILSKDNFDTWKMQMEALLIKNDAWDFVCGKRPKPEIVVGDEASEAAANAWTIGDNKAKSDIILSINPSELKQIKGCVTSREVWQKLESIYQSRGPARKATLLKQLILHRMQDGDDVRHHVRKFFDAVDKLSEMEVDINADLLAILLLYSLPVSFSNFRCAIESRDTLPTPETLRIKIIEESDARTNDTQGAIQNAMAAKGRSNVNKNKQQKSGSRARGDFKFRCRHKAVDCQKGGNFRSFAKASEDAVLCARENFTNTEVASQSETAKSNDIWCLDSGSTSHLCKERDKFVEITDSRSGKLDLATNASSDIVARGRASFTADVRGSKKHVTLKGALHVPDLRNNLLSVAKITDNNCEVVFKKNCATIVGQDGSIKLLAKRVGDLYLVREEGRQSRCLASRDAKYSTNSPSALEVWHRRLGHLNVKDLTMGGRTGAMRGLSLGDCNGDLKCDICCRGKMTRTPFPKQSERKSELLDLVHSDLCGPMRVQSAGGARYIITFIDDKSRWCEVRFLKQKSEASNAFRDFKAMVENQKERKIKCLQSDNGTEYLNKESEEYLKRHGILRRLTIPYNPEQNGVAERKNRTLLEMARCLLIQSNLPSCFWAEAILAANYIRNRCPSRTLGGRTPFELWTGSPPDVSNLREFGSKVFFLDRTPGKGKFDERTKEGVLLGCSERSKGYRVWNPKEKKIEITRDIKFSEGLKPSTGDCEDFVPEEFNVQRQEDVQTPNDEPREVEIEIRPVEDHRRVAPSEDLEDEYEVATDCRDEGRPEDVSMVPRRGPGRPRKIMTGLRGRPRKQYQERPANI